jgi:hypothetical protein
MSSKDRHSILRDQAKTDLKNSKIIDNTCQDDPAGLGH